MVESTETTDARGGVAPTHWYLNPGISERRGLIDHVLTEARPDRQRNWRRVGVRIPQGVFGATPAGAHHPQG
jgi:hypothetical protein